MRIQNVNPIFVIKKMYAAFFIVYANILLPRYISFEHKERSIKMLNKTN